LFYFVYCRRVTFFNYDISAEMSSDESRDPRPMTHLWCRACGHRMHTSAHCKVHFKRRPTHRSYGIHCACCNQTYLWEELVPHLNVRNAHQRPAIVDNPPSPRTASPDRSCSVDSSPRLRPYDLPTAQRRRAGPLRAPHESSLTQARQVPEAALGASPASPMSIPPGTRQDRRYHTGFTASSDSSPSQYLQRPRLDVPPNSTLSYQSPDLQRGDQARVSSSASTGRVSLSSQSLHIPDANWSLSSEVLQPPLPLEDYINAVYTMSVPSTVSSPLDMLNSEDLFLGSATSGLTSDVGSSSRPTSVDTAVSRAPITILSDTDNTSHSTVETSCSPALSATTTVESALSPSSSYVSDRQLLQMAIGQLMWTFGVISTHVRHTQPSDVSDSMGRHLLQSQGHWLIPIPDAMNMPLPELVALLRPVWSQLYYTRR